jgi:hypothetical protein
MEDGLERNTTWLKNIQWHSDFYKQKEKINTYEREKKVFVIDNNDECNIKKIIQNIRKNKIE